VADSAGILGAIATARREDLRTRFAGVSIDPLRARARPTQRRLSRAIARPGARFILEIKKASPSAGNIAAGADVAALARGYAPVADALSVLTEPRHFGGSLDDLAVVRREFDGPILAKDFIVDVRQVVEARIAGADAVLVMLSLLDDAAVRDVIAEAERFAMDALVEVHDEAQLARALALGAPLIGINNRDLRDLSVDLSTTERLARLAPGRLLVAESGIRDRADVDRLAPQVDGFLVGTSLMRAADPAEAARALVFGRVKLCGLRRTEDVEAAAPAAFAGLVFVPDSVRRVSVEAAVPLSGLARRSGMRPVGVFRDEAPSLVADIAQRLDLHAVQLHGSEDGDYVEGLRRQLPEACEIWTAIDASRSMHRREGGDRLVFDNDRGGTGRTFDWHLINDHPRLGDALVAGGIGTDNAGEAMDLGAYAIDVGSRVESSPGVKSADKIRSLFDALRPSCRQELRACA